MNDLFNDAKAVILGLLGLVMSLLTWIFKRELNRVENDIHTLREDMERRHQENLQLLDRIDEATTGTHRRIDDLYRDLIGNGGR